MSDEKQLATVMLYTRRGWGFAELDSDRSSIFLHYSNVVGTKGLHEGDRISCRVVPNDHPKHAWKAAEIEIVEFAPATEVRS